MLSFATLCSVSSCTKRANCNVRESHAHAYVDDVGFLKYAQQECLTDGNYVRHNDYTLLNSEEEKLLKFLNNNGLFRIQDNEDLIRDIQESVHDFTEYRYSFIQVILVGKVPISYVLYSWTEDNTYGELTGEVREGHPVFQAYKLEVDEKGEYVLIPSEFVSDLFSLPSEFQYIKRNFVKAIDLETGLELDYENFPSNKKDFISEYGQTKIYKK